MTDTTLPTPVDAEPSRPPGGGAPAAHVDYEFAKRTGRAIVNPGPQVSSDEAAAIVADLRAAAASAVGPRRRDERPARPGRRARAARRRPRGLDQRQRRLVPGDARPGRRQAQRHEEGARPSATAAAIGGKVTGAEMGGLLAFLSSKVLGQYDLAPGGTPRLLLVAPNIVAAERRLEVDPTDFRRWVAMHEETHRVQFTAVPWLRDHMVARTQALAVDLAPTPEDLSKRFEQLTKNLPEVSQLRRGHRPALRHARAEGQIAEITAVMSLLEGHADVVMDDVGPRGHPERRRDPPQVRRAAQQRRRHRPAAAQAARPRGQDAAVPRRRRLRPGRHGPGRPRRLQRRVDLARDPAARRRDPRARTPGCAGSTAERCEVPQRCPDPTPRSPPPASPCASTSPTCPRAASCSSPARAGPTPSRWRRRSPSRRRAPACAAAPSSSTTGCRSGSAEVGRGRRRAVPRDGARPRRGRPRRRAPERCRPRGRRPLGPLRRHRGGRRPRCAPRWCSSATPATTRPSRCCSACRAARAPGR